MNETNINTNINANEEPKKKVYVKLLVFLVLITAIVVVLGTKFVSFYYKTHGIGGHYFYKGCDAEVVHQLPEGLTDEDISNAVIMDEYDSGFNHEYTTAGESDFFVETHYLLGVQNIDNKNCKVYLLSDCGHYKDSVLQSGGAMYEGSVRENIPSELADIIFSDEETEIKKTITDETEEKVKAYYNTDEVA